MTRAANRSRPLTAATILAVALVVLGACSQDAGSTASPTTVTVTAAPGSGSASATSLPPSLTTFPMPTAGATGGSPPGSTGSTPSTRRVLEGFEEVTVHVRRPDGSVTDHCLLLAASEAQRERGLMQVSDPALGGHPGMLFLFEKDQDGSFWMKDTLLPLSIAYVGADGTVVSSTDMEPCPAGTKNCPTYASRGSYRYAVEVPKGRLGTIGLDQAGSRLTVGERSCPAT